MKSTVVFVAGGVLLVVLGACSSDRADPQTEAARPPVPGFGAHLQDIPSVAFTEEPRWRRVGPAHILTSAEIQANREASKDLPPRPGPTPAELAKWTDLDWVRALRPRVFVNGDEYELDESDAEAISRLRAAATKPVPPAFHGSAPDDTSLHMVAGLETKDILGSDGRFSLGTVAKTNYPERTIGVFSPAGDPATRTPSTLNPGPYCTMTMVGPSTAITAAHCVYDNGWYPLAGWAYGSYWMASGEHDTALHLPTQQQYCYAYLVPSAWQSSNQDEAWDFAFIEYYESPVAQPSCATKPGLVIGNMSMDYYAPIDIWNNQWAIEGYPWYDYPTGTGTLWPTLFHGSQTANQTWVVSGVPTRFVTRIDGSGGQSGAGLRRLATSSIGGIYKGGVQATYAGAPNEPNNDINWGRVIDSTVTSFGIAYTAL